MVKLIDDKHTLEKAIQKAIAGGWTVNGWTDSEDFSWNIEEDGEFDTLHMHYTGLGEDWWLNISAIIFDHDFAKALWGDELIDVNIGARGAYSIDLWKYHIQNMVIADDPIAYLGDNI